MKTLFSISFLLIVTMGFSQEKSIKEQELLSRIYSQRKDNKSIINYDKSFVSDDRLFYESLQGEKDSSTSDEKLIKRALQNYMDGSSYNRRKQIKSAFTNDATLYLTNREGKFKRYTPQEYADFFKNRKEGEFNGRDAKILAFEVTKDIATAKVEIAGPKRKWVYIDLFLLKKLAGEWKIISKTATRIDNNK